MKILLQLTTLLLTSFLIYGNTNNISISNNNNIAPFSAVTIWDGSSWNNGTPNASLICVINGNYSTATYGSFEALELQINAGYTLTINDNTYCKVIEDITVSGNLQINNKGALVQVNDTGIFTLVSGGTSTVVKHTSPLKNWYNYTYWSSPVNGTTVNQAFAFSHPNMRYWFNSANFLDVLAENSNNNTYVSGHDDVDDNGDDWALLNGTDVLQPGTGYAATHSPTAFVPNTSYQYNFVGPLNTGTISVPISYNGDNGDNDWNFIGNPYPSAISADAFFTENSGVIAGAIYLWSHASAATNTNNGNQAYNFNVDDYAIINAGSGEVAGGSTEIPNRFIPSGQGFFVQGLNNGNVNFTNAMRMADTSSNSQFFRQNNTAEANKIWINLTSDNGVFNQALIAYVDGATDNDDGNYFDAIRNLSSGTASIIYSQIDGSNDKKFAIQGKAPESLDLNETIPIGFYTSITAPTTYTLSLAKFEGDFLTTNEIYLKDNLNNIIVDLKQNDYIFSSETGDFSSRFEIVYDNPALSNESFKKDESFNVIELSSSELIIKSTSNSLINEIAMFDTMGRVIIDKKLNESSNREIINTTSISNGSYIIQVKFTSGIIESKKLIKKL